jgi:hypothetical protein
MENQEIKIPTNIMVKSGYPIYLKRQHNFIKDLINEFYNYIYVKTDPNYYDSLEIEAKLGRFYFIGEYIQCMEYLKETFQIPNYDIRDKIKKYEFRSGLEEGEFYTIWYNLEKECQHNPEIKRIEPLTIKDTSYNTGKRKSTVYKNNTIIKEETIRKEDKLHFNIRDMGNDIRFSACKEMKTDITSDDIPIGSRDKFRVSYKFRYFRLDFTIATSNEITYEIELEFEDLKYVVNQFKIYEDFSYLFMRYIENVFCIYNTTSLEYFYDRSNVRNRTGAMFGDYLEKKLN